MRETTATARVVIVSETNKPATKSPQLLHQKNQDVQGDNSPVTEEKASLLSVYTKQEWKSEIGRSIGHQRTSGTIL